mmetsp:Transcript_2531/g.2892  ORF Transcript_2531/g.2892 Transcript_2531/m.2892 type:complete len:120 (+) Transcript_2531:77-436(+)|eukprot:CAMPEP_0204645190 /NCGR_PEP_ID=MMETSP0718-20130828/2010_1 /ASSEMBLY_ACC=CAM_ASM_000674 /TAXON_ID=230516 /ORGANISM="Chaetoceros curvisetus" /LENGTH=119 /DNA_ID=CAMNT_0051666955 /DNA_START=63 /DNA_END=422 /DNA_ORIENTATION=-
MNKLSGSEKQELATSLAILALYDGGAEVSAEQINTILEATGNEVEAFYPIIFANYLSNPEKIAELITTPGGAGGGGGAGGDAGGAGGDDAEAEEEEEEVEEEAPPMATDMFGGDDGGDY